MTLYFKVDGEINQIGHATSCDDIRFDDFCDFRTEEAKYQQAIRDDKPIEEIQSILADALLNIIPGDVRSLPFAVSDTDHELVDTTYQIQLNEEISLLRLYAHYLNMIQAYKPNSIPETFVVNRWPWAKDRYKIKSKPAARMILDRPLNTGEAIECLEWKRITDRAVEAKPLGVGNIEFTYGLTQIALLLRKEGERLPSDRRKLDQFIAQRRTTFQGLPLSVILDIRFFLIAALTNYGTTRDSGSFGTDLRVVTKPSLLSNKRTKRRRKRKRGR